MMITKPSVPMDKLYTEMANVYDIMYRQLMDYDSEFAYYHPLLQAHGVQSVVELGCGTGNNAARMVAHGYDYRGIDLSADMLDLARKRLPNTLFLQADMRHLDLSCQCDAVLLFGRTSAYLLSNDDVEQMLRSAHRQLKTGGILVFDVIDANQFLPQIDPQQSIRHSVYEDGVTYWRDSVFTHHHPNAWTWQWAAQYYRQADTDKDATFLTQDTNLLRSFTVNEIQLFLRLNGFEVLAQYPKSSYAFPTWVFVARK